MNWQGCILFSISESDEGLMNYCKNKLFKQQKHLKTTFCLSSTTGMDFLWEALVALLQHLLGQPVLPI